MGLSLNLFESDIRSSHRVLNRNFKAAPSSKISVQNVHVYIFTSAVKEFSPFSMMSLSVVRKFHSTVVGRLRIKSPIITRWLR